MTSNTEDRSQRPTSWRRSPSRGDLRHEKILQVAEELLQAKHLSDITIEEIATGAGITRPTFYFYFDSKYALLAALVEDLMEHKFDAAASWFVRPDDIDPHQALIDAYTKVLKLWKANRRIVEEAANAIGLDANVRSVYLELVNRFVTATTAQIKRERLRGAAPPGPDPEALASTLIWMGERALYAAIADLPPPLTDAERIEAITEVWLRTVYGTLGPLS